MAYFPVWRHGMRNLSFTIPGRIGGKGRHRSAIRNGKMQTFTPARTQSDEALVRHFAAQAMREKKISPLRGALQMFVAVYRHHPKSWSSKRRLERWITGKPDCDNIIKLISDAMNCVAYGDDSQIANIVMQRMYCRDINEPENVFVCVQEIGE